MHKRVRILFYFAVCRSRARLRQYGVDTGL